MPLLMGLFAVGVARAQEGETTARDWIVTLTWSPEYCNAHLGLREPQCTEEHFFEIGGLRTDPQGEACDTNGESISEKQFPQLFTALPNRGALKRIWSRQGACTGLGINEYFVQFNRAKRRVTVPAGFREVRETLKMPVEDLKAAFVKSNPDMTANGVRLQCSGRWLKEVEICLDRNFEFRACGEEPADHCKPEVHLRESRAIVRGR